MTTTLNKANVNKWAKNINGWLNIYKPKGISSARLVAIVKKSFPKVKIGHTGTLDPLADGVLPIALGEATKLASFLVDSRKKYIFTIQFGANTTTGDAAGEIINRVDHYPTKDEIYSVLNNFRGEIEQTPPKYSAVKINGVRAYKLARSNAEFSIKSRKVQIYKLELLSFDSTKGLARFKVQCSKGTYIRSLAEDISLSLQNFGFVVKLRRSAVGIFSIEKSVDLSEHLQGDWQEAKPLLEQNLLRLETVLDDIPVLDVSKEQVRMIKCGKRITFETEINQLYSDQSYSNKFATNMDANMAAFVDCKYDLNTNDKDDASAGSLLIWVRNNGHIVAIGDLLQDYVFKSRRVFNVNFNDGENDVDYC